MPAMTLADSARDDDAPVRGPVPGPTSGAADAAGNPAGEPESAKRRQIIEGARKVFFDRGFDAASMGEIAREAGVSKGTLYVYFDSKEALFAALIEDAKDYTAEKALTLDLDEPDIAKALADFGRTLLRRLSAPRHIALVRMVVGVGDKFPDLARIFFDAGPRRGRDALIAYLTAQTELGRLRVDEPEIAAAQFLGMCCHMAVMRCLLAGEPLPEPASLERYATSAARVFMAAYGPEAARDS